MKNYSPTSTVRASTYSLLTQNEEKRSSLLETAVFLLIILSVTFSIWQFAKQPLPLPGDPNAEPAMIARTIETAQQDA